MFFSELKARFKHGYQTAPYPMQEPSFPGRFRGAPVIDHKKCEVDCTSCADVCPSGAISFEGKVRIDLGRCVFCPECERACPKNAIEFTNDYKLATSKRGDLVTDGSPLKLATPAKEELRCLFQKSFKLRQVSAAGCNGCEAEIAACGNIVFDIGKFGIQVVASPRHADGLLVTGPVSQNMSLALRKTHDATPDPKIVVAVGSCAISGGPFRDLPEQKNGAEADTPVELYIPGCPPHPFTIMDGLLRLLGRVDKTG